MGWLKYMTRLKLKLKPKRGRHRYRRKTALQQTKAEPLLLPGQSLEDERERLMRVRDQWRQNFKNRALAYRLYRPECEIKPQVGALAPAAGEGTIEYQKEPEETNSANYLPFAISSALEEN